MRPKLICWEVIGPSEEHYCTTDCPSSVLTMILIESKEVTQSKATEGYNNQINQCVVKTTLYRTWNSSTVSSENPPPASINVLYLLFLSWSYKMAEVGVERTFPKAEFPTADREGLHPGF